TVAPRKYAFLRLRVNDDRADAARTNAYILRAQLLDNFYAIQEFYIQSLGDHELTAELSLLPESEQSLLVYNIDLHDRFGQCARRRGKRGTSLVDVEARHRLWAEAQETQAHKAAPPAGDQEQRDDAAWNGWLPPLNTHTGQNLGTGRYDRAHWDTDRWCMAPEEWKGKTLLGKPLVREFGTDPLYRDSRGGLHAEPPRYAVDSGTCWWRNEKLGPFAEITVKDGAVHHKGRRVGEVAHANTRDGMLLEDGRPVRKVGRFYALQGHKTFDPQGQRHLVGEVRMRPGLTYDSEAVTNAYRLAWRDGAAKGIGRLSHWQQRGDRQAARDQAMRLVRFAWDWPAVRPSRQLNFIMGGQGLDRRYVRRYQWYPPHDSLLDIYDSLFEFIDGNEAFARAVGRYLPYIKTPDDVVRFLDTRLVQDYANDMMHYRYYYDHGQAKLMVKAVLVQGDPAITAPWMAFLWARGWEYPQALSGAADNIVTSIGRDGGTNVGSIFYGIGGQLGTVQLLETYIGAGGDAKYDLTDPARYPKSRETIFLPFESAAAGRHVLGVGDVGGPSCAYGRIVHLANLRGIFATGWRWTRDPRFAYELVHTFGRKGEPGDEWGPIVAAAATTRDPYLMNRSRILADWSAFLTGGPDEDDFRFRRSVAVRVGNGHGHAHADTLDLRLWAHGVTMSGDLGMRPAYGRPGHQRSRVHNVVEVDGRDWNSHAWAPHLFDAPGAAYLVAESTAPYGMEHVTLFRRQTALVDADPGVRSPKKPPQTDPDVTTPSSYVFDVFRVAGGSTHTYCFHGCVDDGFEVNVANRRAMT
ncbi:heparinase II/III family protein, partial [bacterium]|nr:heparinase II/III family protein [bacterium]